MAKNRKTKSKTFRDRVLACGLPYHIVDMYRTCVVWYDLKDLDRVEALGADLYRLRENAEDAGALCHDVTIEGFRYQFVGLKDDDDPNTLLSRVVHENVHVINNIWRHAGVNPDLDNDEHQAYFAESLAFYGFRAASTLFGQSNGKKS